MGRSILALQVWLGVEQRMDELPKNYGTSRSVVKVETHVSGRRSMLTTKGPSRIYHPKPAAKARTGGVNDKDT